MCQYVPVVVGWRTWAWDYNERILEVGYIRYETVQSGGTTQALAGILTAEHFPAGREGAFWYGTTYLMVVAEWAMD